MPLRRFLRVLSNYIFLRFILKKDKLKLIVSSLLKLSSYEGYYGSTSPISNFDLRKTKEFGMHFALGSPESSLHRIKDSGYLYKVQLNFSNPLVLNDLFRWTLDAVLMELKVGSAKVREYKLRASSLARQKGTSLREEENVLLGDILTDLGYDAILYDNKGEAGGKAVIVWDPSQVKVISETKI